MTRHKHQPTADTMREQLALAADEIIRLRTARDGERRAYYGAGFDFAMMLATPEPRWHTRLWARIRGWFA